MLHLHHKIDFDTQTSLNRLFSRRFQLKLMLEGTLVGLFGGGVVTLYRLSLSHAEEALRFLTHEALGNLLLMLAWFVVLVGLAFIVAALVTWEPAISGSGIAQVDAEVMGKYSMPWHRVIIAKFLSGTLLSFGGLSLGREGPAVQLGGASGKAVAKLFSADKTEDSLLMTCGAAAGMSAAFHAPLTGVLFAVEEIHKQFNAPLIITVMCSAVASDFMVSQVLGIAPVIHIGYLDPLPHDTYLLLILMGIIFGFLGALHNKGMFFSQKMYNTIRSKQIFFRYVIPFLLAGVVAFTFPQLMCGGDAIIEHLMTINSLPVLALFALLLGKYVFTSLSFGSGAPGGTLFPLVVMGALAGGLYASTIGRFFGLDTEYFHNFLAFGIAALFSSVVRAPICAVVLVFELTGSLEALLSVSLVSILSYVTANLLQVDPFYEHLLHRFVCSYWNKHADHQHHYGERALQRIRIARGSKLDGALVKDVPWPKAARVISITRVDAEIIPIGTTRLSAFDELLLIYDTAMAGETLDALRDLSELSASELQTTHTSTNTLPNDLNTS